MVRLWVNNTLITTERSGSLLLFLRDQLSLHALKCGCMQGSCGTCSVLVDGKLRRSCILQVERLDGRHILTPEGLSAREKELYTSALSAAGAIQCGYCLPGITMAIKGLLDRNPLPDEPEIRAALSRNLCRCTGYTSLIRAVQQIAATQSGRLKLPSPTPLKVGASAARIDAFEKVSGSLHFVADDVPHDTLHGCVRLSDFSHARILAIHTEKAISVPGVHAVLTAADIPGIHTSGRLRSDWPVLVGVGEEVLFRGDCVALVAADSRSLAEKAAAMIEVDYESLPAVFSPDEAMLADAPQLHPGGNLFFETHVEHGDLPAAELNTYYSVENTYETPFAEHAYLETEACVAYEQNGRLVIHSADQGIYSSRDQIAKVLACQPEQLLVKSAPVGGAFGGREDVLIQIQAALLVQKTHQPVFLSYSREESLRIHAKRHPMKIFVRSGCDAKGQLTYLSMQVIADKGAHASLGIPVLERACSMAPGPYRYQAVSISGSSYYTNNPPTGSYRGFGITQTCFAVESNLNLLAQKVGISPWEIRWRNAVSPGENLFNGQFADSSTAIRETLQAVKDIYENAPLAGIACAMKNCGSGWGIPDIGRCRLHIHHGHIFLFSAASRIGQGVETILLQIAASSSGVDSKRMRLGQQDTDLAPDTGTATASRLTLIAGEAARRAGHSLRMRLDEFAAYEEDALLQLEGESFWGEFSAETESPSSSDHPVIHAAYGYATHVVVLDSSGDIEKIVAAHDVGHAINPLNIKGQIEGGVVMSYGFAVTEHLNVCEGSVDTVFSHIGLPTSLTAPEVEAVIVEKSTQETAYGAKGLGELACIPTPAAISGAYEVLDGLHRVKLPLTPPINKRKGSAP